MKFRLPFLKILRKERIYILPTRMGGYYNGLIFLLFLLSIGYSSNLLLIFTLVLLGLNFLWLIQTHFHLRALALGEITLEDGFANEGSHLQIRWKKSRVHPEGPKLSLLNERALPITIQGFEGPSLQGQVTFPKRGKNHFTHLLVETSHPYGLYRAWTYFWIDLEIFVYPERLKHRQAMELSAGRTEEGEQVALRPGPWGLQGFSRYENQGTNRIHWKHFANSGELIVKEGEEETTGEVRLELSPTHLDKEFELSRLATILQQCEDLRLFYSLLTPQKFLPRGRGREHLRACLRELALC
jgi:uncharacterized protein (DUF58 family)